MDEEAKTNGESWAVEPPKKASSRKRKALRIALIVAAVGAAAAAAAVYARTGRDRDDNQLKPPSEIEKILSEHPGGVIDVYVRPDGGSCE